MRLCALCNHSTSNSYGLCDDCRRDTTIAERAEQGLPPTVEDPAALHTLAVLADAAPRREEPAA